MKKDKIPLEDTGASNYGCLMAAALKDLTLKGCQPLGRKSHSL